MSTFQEIQEFNWKINGNPYQLVVVVVLDVLTILKHQNKNKIIKKQT